MPTTYSPPFLFTATHTLGTLSLTGLSTLMLTNPHLYHKHILRSTNPSTTDLFISTQFTNSTQEVLNSSIRSSGIFLLSTSIGLFATRNHYPSSFYLLSTVSLGVAAGHAYLLKPILTNDILRRAWLEESERVAKMGVVVGVNALTVLISLWAGLSYGGWPWHAERMFFSAPVGNPSGQSFGSGNPDDFDLEGVVNVFVKGAVELAGGVGGLLQGVLAASS
ncbi:hypothetical protein TWF788_006718 [Orbilia oligospora]|uniref:Uncharacterized protein n=2 Tax=Orbilia oligospora TaxID=2813651 RepID=A0A6G1MHG6_ORBOL|nr:hypothetical protein TWF788_006718 [Orbilia oligospora]KAF3231535.1 hypothetical protein TWF191_005605 [Orbilia oligospora]KAF3257688.1 hypothetical protein TWF192_000979 [Orbilia oligospora]